MPRRLGSGGKAVGPHHFHEQEDVVEIERGITSVFGFHSLHYAVFPRNRGTRYAPRETTSQMGNAMAKVLVLYYSSIRSFETMANAVAEGARSAGATVDLKRVPETVSADVAKAAHFKLDQKAPVAKIDELADYDAIIIGAPTRFGRMASQMAAFLDQAGGLWAKGKFNGKVGGAFTSTATQHGGQETTLFSIIANLLHFG